MPKQYGRFWKSDKSDCVYGWKGETWKKKNPKDKEMYEYYVNKDAEEWMAVFPNFEPLPEPHVCHWKDRGNGRFVVTCGDLPLNTARQPMWTYCPVCGGKIEET